MYAHLSHEQAERIREMVQDYAEFRQSYQVAERVAAMDRVFDYVDDLLIEQHENSYDDGYITGCQDWED